jgi:hypothetical protein
VSSQPEQVLPATTQDGETSHEAPLRSILLGPAAPELTQSTPELAATNVQKGLPIGKRLDNILQADPAKEGREAIVARAEQFLAEFSDHPQSVDVMLKVGNVFELRNRKASLESQITEAKSWYRRAVLAAAPGSEAWFDSRWALINVLHRRNSTPDELAEARTLLKTMATHAGDRPFVLFSVEFQLARQCIFEGDTEGVERHFRNVSDWQPAPGLPPLGEAEQVAVAVKKSIAANELIHRLASPPRRMTSAEIEARAEKIRELATSHDVTPVVKQAADEKLNDLAQARQLAKRFEPASMATGMGPVRTIFVTVNLAVIVVLIGLIVRSKRMPWRSLASQALADAPQDDAVKNESGGTKTPRPSRRT